MTSDAHQNTNMNGGRYVAGPDRPSSVLQAACFEQRPPPPSQADDTETDYCYRTIAGLLYSMSSVFTSVDIF